MLWLIPVICAVLAAACTLAGAAAVVRASRTLADHADRLQAAAPLALLDSGRFETATARIERDFDGMKLQLMRAAAAVEDIRKGLTDLRLREAVMALRVAGAALRALRALF